MGARACARRKARGQKQALGRRRVREHAPSLTYSRFRRWGGVAIVPRDDDSRRRARRATKLAERTFAN